MQDTDSPAYRRLELQHNLLQAACSSRPEVYTRPELVYTPVPAQSPRAEAVVSVVQVLPEGGQKLPAQKLAVVVQVLPGWDRRSPGQKLPSLAPVSVMPAAG